jgi:hypothetical protein
MNHLHLVLKKQEETRYELSLKQRKMYEQIEGEFIDDIIIYSDSSFNESDREFIRSDLNKELKKQYNLFEEKMRYSNNAVPSIIMENRLIIKTDDLDGLLNKLYGLADFYQMMYKYNPLALSEPEIEEAEETEDGEEEGDEYEGQFHYY